MLKEFERPHNRNILEDREAAGLWKAIALSKEIGEGKGPVDLGAVLMLHNKIFEHAIPEIAGRFRKSGEDVKKLTCIEPPPGAAVEMKMHQFEHDLIFRIEHTDERPNPKADGAYATWLTHLFELAAWTHHTLVAIHPFCEGNGRVARLVTNVILRRFHIPPTDVKIEADNKQKYLTALCQVDNHGDYGLLRELLIQGSIATLNSEKEKRRKKQGA